MAKSSGQALIELMGLPPLPLNSHFVGTDVTNKSRADNVSKDFFLRMSLEYKIRYIPIRGFLDALSARKLWEFVRLMNIQARTDTATLLYSIGKTHCRYFLGLRFELHWAI